MSEPMARREAPPTAPTERCRFCGAFTSLRLGDVWICESCYQERGSCCTEGPDDQS